MSAKVLLYEYGFNILAVISPSILRNPVSSAQKFVNTRTMGYHRGVAPKEVITHKQIFKAKFLF